MSIITEGADRPSFKILIDGTQIKGEYQIQGLEISLGFNKVASAEILILDGDPSVETFSASDAGDFVPGNEIEILAGYHGDEKSLFKGIIIRHGLRVYSRKPSLLRVECKDAAVKLTIGRKNAYFYESTDSEIIDTIAGNAGLEKDVEATNTTHPEMVQFYATDWDFILMRAEANGKLVTTRHGKLIVKSPDSGGDPLLTMVFGRDMLEFEAVMDARLQFDKVESYAWQAADQQMLQIDGSAPTTVIPGNITESDLAAVIDLESLQLKHGGQLKDDELQAWSDGQLLKSSLSKVRGRIRIQGFAIEPGDIIELAGAGDRFNGKALVSAVHHQINYKNWETEIFFGLSPEWFGVEEKRIVDAAANGLLPGISGLHIGLVSALEGDPDGEDRIQVRIPMIDPDEQGVWSRVASLDAGKNRGAFFRPEIGDEVVLGFLNQDPRNPVVVGMLNSSAKPAPVTASDDNHEKGFVTRSELKMMFNDDEISFTVETPNGNKIVISDNQGSIVIADENSNTITMDASGISIESAGDINLKASGDVNVEGTNTNIKASAQYKAEGSSGAEMSTGATAVLKGSLVQIN